MRQLSDITEELTQILKKTGEVLKMHALIGFLVTLIVLILVVVILYGGESLLEGKDEIQYTVSWLEKSSPEILHSHELKERDVLIIENDINQQNLTIVQFELCWEDNRDGFIRNLSDMLTMEIEPPPNTRVKFQSSNIETGYESPLRITAMINPLPNDMTFNDLDVNEVYLRVNEYSTINGWGNWKINLSIEARSLFDRGNNVQLKVNYDYYQPLIEKQL
jgi:hypothetical protein